MSFRGHLFEPQALAKFELLHYAPVMTCMESYGEVTIRG
jgi:hypothetical protein